MQIFHFSNLTTVILCFVLWPFFQTASALLCKKIPGSFFRWDNRVFSQKKFEKDGIFYKRVFKIDSWKKFLPDGAAVQKSGYRKKHLTDFSVTNLNVFLLESCRAELAHLLAIPPFLVFALFLPLWIVCIMLLYALIINLPCIMAQRYNRPRVARLIKKIEKNERPFKYAV